MLQASPNICSSESSCSQSSYGTVRRRTNIVAALDVQVSRVGTHSTAVKTAKDPSDVHNSNVFQS